MSMHYFLDVISILQSPLKIIYVADKEIPGLIVRFVFSHFTRNTRDIFHPDNFITLVPEFRFFNISSRINCYILSFHVIALFQFPLQLEGANLTLIFNTFISWYLSYFEFADSQYPSSIRSTYFHFKLYLRCFFFFYSFWTRGVSGIMLIGAVITFRDSHFVTTSYVDTLY